MKKLLCAIFCICLSGCVTYNIWNPPKVEEIDPVEIVGLEGKELQGKLWMSTCQSNAFGNQDTARATAIKNMEEKANELGYKYFTLLDKHVSMQENLGSYTTHKTNTSFTNVNLSTYSTGTITGARNQELNVSSRGRATGTATTTTSTPETHYYTTYFHTYIGFFLLLEEKDLKKAPNIYSVEKYIKK